MRSAKAKRKLKPSRDFTGPERELLRTYARMRVCADHERPALRRHAKRIIRLNPTVRVQSVQHHAQRGHNA